MILQFHLSVETQAGTESAREPFGPLPRLKPPAIHSDYMEICYACCLYLWQVGKGGLEVERGARPGSILVKCLGVICRTDTRLDCGKSKTELGQSLAVYVYVS